ncbi:MAG: gluconate:proton symporter [Candidatus Epulonipiscioides saccharophilum]|nr:MAG: gluconate:proton symporter [Epulopiscium sp. AS2M-Bin001]
MPLTFISLSTLGALLGLTVTIILIIRKVEAAYAMMCGALIGGLLGGMNLVTTVDNMISGAQSMMPTIIRVLTSGVLAGTLIKSGAANQIAEKIISSLGEKRSILAIALSTMILTAVGVFIDVATLTVAPIAISVGNKLKYSKYVLLIALIGGGKAGNMFSPNPNSIVIAENFNISLSSVMLAGIIPGLVGLLVTILLATYIQKRYESKNLEFHAITESSSEIMTADLPTILSSISGPLVVIFLLMLRPIAGINIDPLIALPTGGLVGIFAMKKSPQVKEYLSFGLKKMMPVGILLIGTGTIAGVIKASQLQYDIIAMIEILSLPEFLLAPIAGILASAATASTSAGSALASSTFASTITQVVSALSGAVMVHTGANVMDTLPHGSFFHISANSVNMNISSRMKLLPADILIGFSTTLAATLIYGLLLG